MTRDSKARPFKDHTTEFKFQRILTNLGPLICLNWVQAQQLTWGICSEPIFANMANKGILAQCSTMTGREAGAG